MSEQNSGQEKTEEASAHKLKKSKDDGQVARSKDLSHLAVLGGGMVLLMVLAAMAMGTRTPGFYPEAIGNVHKALVDQLPQCPRESQRGACSQQ